MKEIIAKARRTAVKAALNHPALAVPIKIYVPEVGRGLPAS
jgi:hypothetical protein